MIQALRIAYYHEGDNKVIPIMTASCMDRLMYRYHYGKLSIDHLSFFCGIITNTGNIEKKFAAASLNIFITRCLIELKRTKQDIFIATQKANENNIDIDELKRRYDRHEKLIKLVQKEVLPKIHKLIDEFPEESEEMLDKLPALLGDYYEDLVVLKKQIQSIESKQ